MIVTRPDDDDEVEEGSGKEEGEEEGEVEDTRQVLVGVGRKVPSEHIKTGTGGEVVSTDGISWSKTLSDSDNCVVTMERTISGLMLALALVSCGKERPIVMIATIEPASRRHAVNRDSGSCKAELKFAISEAQNTV